MGKRKPKIVTDISERNMVGRKLHVELDGPVGKDGATIKIHVELDVPVGKDGATIKITGYVVAQYVDDGELEQTTIMHLLVSGPILGT